MEVSTLLTSLIFNSESLVNNASKLEDDFQKNLLNKKNSNIYESKEN